EQGLPYLDKALALNPDAHFGRERYQKWLVEYALTRRKGGKLALPLRLNIEDARKAQVAANFHGFLAQCLGQARLSLEDMQKAVKGVLGMMRFANHANPLLLEALGDLLSSPRYESADAKRLAARAYLKAAYGAEDAATKQAYRDLAKQALSMQTPDPNTHNQL